ncbi:hypothetical protein LQG66_26100 [Bradyrhizobium ontarionense]|uniref:Uncharacterized protein n=1 Tax=Bradyrhizobium ontarionense TaxID=2898149 RepID=A0ABY3R5V5_9BRAD|nr:hypothetical protein [Bradyrhizobium sp. A19]UFZ02724.1 hypothetical protein LQG66_26100 [Bradyrhizobium sp. A19]
MSLLRRPASADERPPKVADPRRQAPLCPSAVDTRSWPLLVSLRAFVDAGLRPKTPLQRTIAAALCIKLLVVLSMRMFVALDDSRVVASDHAVARVIGVEQR